MESRRRTQARTSCARAARQASAAWHAKRCKRSICVRSIACDSAACCVEGALRMRRRHPAGCPGAFVPAGATSAAQAWLPMLPPAATAAAAAAHPPSLPLFLANLLQAPPASATAAPPAPRDSTWASARPARTARRAATLQQARLCRGEGVGVWVLARALVLAAAAAGYRLWCVAPAAR